MTQVCDECGSEDIEYCDQDDTLHYCSDCYMELDPEFIKMQRIKPISIYINHWTRKD